MKHWFECVMYGFDVLRDIEVPVVADSVVERVPVVDRELHELGGERSGIDYAR